MTKCAQCGTMIVFGGIQVGQFRFCEQACHDIFMLPRLNKANDAYQWHLAQLRANPSSPDLKTKTLAAGRAYAAFTRDGIGTTVFDEVALANDIQAACAGATSIATKETSTLSIEERLHRLEEFHKKNLISDEEYQAKRSKILDEL